MTGALRVMHTWTTDLGVYGARRILQASVFAADTVLLPATAQIDPALSLEERRFVEGQLVRVRDLGALELWVLEADVAVTPLVSGAPTTVISDDDYAKVYEAAINSLIAQRRDFLGDQRALHFDGMTEIILGKHATIHAELCRHLGARSVLHDRGSAAGYGQFLAQLNEQHLVDGVVEEIQASLGLPDLSDLPDHVLVSARSSLDEFRARVTALLSQHGVAAGPQGLQSLKELVARHVVVEFQAARERVRIRNGSPIRRGIWRLRRVLRRRDDTSQPLQLLLELDGHKEHSIEA